MANRDSKKAAEKHQLRYENGGPATGGQNQAERKDSRMEHRQGGSQDADVRQQRERSHKGVER